MRLSRTLHSIPRVSFSTDKRSEFQFKRQPADFCLATIEAVHQFIDLWNSVNSIKGREHDALLSVFRAMVSHQIESKCSRQNHHG